MTEYTGYGTYPANQPHETGEGLRGFVLLVAGVTQNRRKNRALEDSEAALAGWVGLPPQILIPGAPADVVQLPNGSGPQTVRGYLERASASPGPVLVCLTGHLMPDRRGELHVTLRASSPGSVRYDGLPWAWLVETLRARDPRQTLVIADLTASDQLRAEVSVTPARLTERLPLWAVLTRQPSHDERAHAFTRALTAAARRGFAGCPALVDAATLHPVVAAGTQLPDGSVQIVPPPESALKLANPLPATAVPQQAIAVYNSGLPPVAPTSPPVSAASPPQAFGISGHATGLEPAAHTAPKTPPVPKPAPLSEVRADEAELGAHDYREGVGELRDAVAAGDFDHALDLARRITREMETLDGLGPEHPDTLDALETWAWLTARAGLTDEAVSLYTETAQRSARIHGPGHAVTRAAADAAHALWLMLPNVARARELGPAVMALRSLVLGQGASAREPAAAYAAALSAPPQGVGLLAAPGGRQQTVDDAALDAPAPVAPAPDVSPPEVPSRTSGVGTAPAAPTAVLTTPIPPAPRPDPDPP
ncbi:MAG TPA: hypothetical protein VLH10_13500, partial [Yinghuangia sp.]|nr:hypothetical protein [Yinghuangia sp.]